MSSNANCDAHGWRVIHGPRASPESTPSLDTPLRVAHTLRKASTLAVDIGACKENAEAHFEHPIEWEVSHYYSSKPLQSHDDEKPCDASKELEVPERESFPPCLVDQYMLLRLSPRNSPESSDSGLKYEGNFRCNLATHPTGVVTPRINQKKRGREPDDKIRVKYMHSVPAQALSKKVKKSPVSTANENPLADRIQCQWGEVVTGKVLCSTSCDSVNDLINHLENKHWKPEVQKEKAAYQSNPDTKKQWFAGASECCYCGTMCYRTLKKHIRAKHTQVYGPKPTGEAVPLHCVVHKGFSH
ncbi:hypothetical protein FA15DRAFT_657217 [Coprinopsis marcescibilis]|uniref:Uncharacterized protein n=1 Tax=Coprinopsis marcescibilis TaxID=230819 RepID=A0A5C3KR42_COPMA|nr:hypothetical protein FA15DRAFT_657217 [Coprinopsis marcescibilis]